MRASLVPTLLEPTDDTLVVAFVSSDTQLHEGRLAAFAERCVGDSWKRLPRCLGLADRPPGSGLQITSNGRVFAVVNVSPDDDGPSLPTKMTDGLEGLSRVTSSGDGHSVLILADRVNSAGLSVPLVALVAEKAFSRAATISIENDGNVIAPPEFDGWPGFMDEHVAVLPSLAAKGAVPSVRAALNAVATRRAERVYSRRLGVFHPSSLGSECLLRVGLERAGACPEVYADTGYGAATKSNGESERGNVVHHFFQARFAEAAAMPDNNIMAFTAEVPVYHKTFMISGHADGVLLLRTPEGPQEWILEIKSTTDLPQGVRTKDKAQNLAYQIGLGIPRTLFLYADPSSLEYVEYPYEYEPSRAAPLLSRMEVVDRALAAGRLPTARYGAHCRWCGYHSLCQRLRSEEERSE